MERMREMGTRRESGKARVGWLVFVALITMVFLGLQFASLDRGETTGQVQEAVQE